MDKAKEAEAMTNKQQFALEALNIEFKAVRNDTNQARNRILTTVKKDPKLEEIYWWRMATENFKKHILKKQTKKV